MKGNITLRKLAALLVVAVMAVMTVGPLPASGAASPNLGVLPPHTQHYGYTYPEWGARYVQWFFSIPKPLNPWYNDETGANCGVAQSGPVWFLASASGGTIVRNCTMQAGKAILLPIMFAECSALEPIESGFHGDNEAELRDCARAAMDILTNPTASVDGVPITGLLTTYRDQSPLFTFTLPDDNVMQWFYPGIDAPAGTTSPAVADSVLVLLEPLSVGQHTIHVSGTFPGFFDFDVTYRLTVRSQSPSFGPLRLAR